MATKSGEMRQTLLDSINEVRAGRMDPAKATAIAKLAAQVSLSMQVEANMRVAKIMGPVEEVFGGMTVGAELPAPAPASLVHRISDDEPPPRLRNSVFSAEA